MWGINKLSIRNWQINNPLSSPNTLTTVSLQQHIPIWFEFEPGNRIDLNSHVIIEDPRGLYQFLQYRGQHMIAKQKRS